MDLLQKWWEQTYPNAGVKNVYEIWWAEPDFLYDFHKWLKENNYLTV